jgi:hypothetical protein
LKPNFSRRGTNTVAPMLPKSGTGSADELDEKRRKASIIHPIPSKGNIRWIDPIDKRLYEANHLSKKVGPRQDLNRVSMVIEGIKRNLTANLGGVVEVPDLQNVLVNAMNAVNQNLAFEFAALTKIPPILCIRLVSVSFQRVKRSRTTLETFANDRR